MEATLAKAKAYRLRSARLRAGYSSVEAAASAMGVSEHAYRKHETAARSISDGKATEYAEFFGVSLGWLILGYEDSNGMDNLSIPAASRITELREQMDDVVDMLTGLDIMGDGLVSDDIEKGYAVSAVALAARSVADNVLQTLKAMERS